MEARLEKMRQGIRPGSGGGGGGGGSYTLGRGGRSEYGHIGYSYWEGDTVVFETHRFHAGHELEVEERLRLADGGAKLVYVHSITGPGGKTDAREIGFDVRKEGTA
jgi:hypothetical protein